MSIGQQNNLTVVIPTFNRSQELVRALGSLVLQSDSDFEVIVCDDGSTEDIATAICNFHTRLRLQLLRIDNSGGPARPRNVATKAATTRWVSYLDSDDWWYPSRVERLKGALDDNCDIVYHPLQVERDDRRQDIRPPHGSRIGDPMRVDDPVWHMVRFGNPLPTSGTTVRREAMNAIGGFDESRDLASVEDFDAWLRLVVKGARVRFIAETLGVYWIGSDQISAFNTRQFECQTCLFERQLKLLPRSYRLRAKSNFAYLLGSYALELRLPGAQSYLRDVRLSDEPLRWFKAQVKILQMSWRNQSMQ